MLSDVEPNTKGKSGRSSVEKNGKINTNGTKTWEVVHRKLTAHLPTASRHLRWRQNPTWGGHELVFVCINASLDFLLDPQTTYVYTIELSERAKLIRKPTGRFRLAENPYVMSQAAWMLGTSCLVLLLRINFSDGLKVLRQYKNGIFSYSVLYRKRKNWVWSFNEKVKWSQMICFLTLAVVCCLLGGFFVCFFYFKPGDNKNDVSTFTAMRYGLAPFTNRHKWSKGESWVSWWRSNAHEYELTSVSLPGNRHVTCK